MKKIIFIIFLFFLSLINVEAKCDYSTVARLKSLATNINISYDYRIENNSVYFQTTINNITPELYLIDNATQKKYTYLETNEGELVIDNYVNAYGDRYIIYSNVDECKDKLLLSKYYTFPKYNYYHNSLDCMDIQNYSLCKKWVPEGTSFNNFQENIREYKEKIDEDNDLSIEENIITEKSVIDKILSFYIKYYIFILMGVIILCGIIIIIKQRKENFKL